MPTKLDILSGFLGAGKTTLIKKLLKESLVGEKVVIIENEFGEIGIDGGILKQTGVQIREISSGCICCSLMGDFETALKDVMRQYQPERVLIEPSGVGKLSDVLRICNEVISKTDAVVNMCIAVVDAIKFQMYSRNFAEFYNDQIEHAKTILLSRTQKTEPEKLMAIVKEIQHRNPNASIITTPWEKLSGDRILEVAQRADSSLLNSQTAEAEHHEHCCGHSHEHSHASHEAGESFDVWSIQIPKLFRKSELANILNELPKFGTVLRAKGIIAIEDGSWLQFDFVPEEISIRAVEPDFTGRLCVIGKDLNKSGLVGLFGV